jgi:RNA polymerase sigma factor (sigma-70 family)
MAPGEELVSWGERLRGTDPAAAEEVFARYARRLTGLAERHLSRKLAGRVDGEDVMQSALRTFFRRCKRGDFRIDSSAQLWRLLVRITLMKARAQGRYHCADKRNVGAESLEGGDDRVREQTGKESDPADAAALAEQIEALLRGLPPLYGEVLERRLEGQEVAEVARELGVSRQTVYRMLDLLQKRCAALDAEACGEQTP